MACRLSGKFLFWQAVVL